MVHSPAPPAHALGAVSSIGASSEEPAVVIIGVASRFARGLVRSLHRRRRVLGIDRRPFIDRPKDVAHHEIEVVRSRARDVFRSEKIAAVVHLGLLHHHAGGNRSEMHTSNVLGFQRVLEYVAQYRIPKLVILSSATVYGARPDNPQFLREDAPLLAGASRSDVRDLVEIDMLAQSFFWKQPETETVILRPCHILGRVHNVASNYLRLGIVPTLLGFDPMMQVVHDADVAAALSLALTPGIRGVFNVAGPPPVALSRLLRTLGRSTMPIPHPLAASVVGPLWRLRVGSFPAPELDYIRYVCMVDDSRARTQLGYRPLRSLEETLRAVDDGRWRR